MRLLSAFPRLRGLCYGECMLKRPAYKRILGAATLLLFGCLFAALVAETVVRLVVPQQEIPRWFAESDEYAYVLKKNFEQDFPYIGFGYTMHVKTNSIGHRDDEPPANLSTDSKTILLLGDSFIFGYGVDVADRLDTKLDELFAGPNLPRRVINAGTPGWGTAQEVKYGRATFAQFNPDAIVLTFCGNDPLDDRLFLNGELVFKENGLVRLPGKKFLRQRSHLYRFALTQSKIIRHNIFLRSKKKKEPQVQLDTQSASIIGAEDWKRTLEQIILFHEDYRAFNPSAITLVQTTSPENEEFRRHFKTLEGIDGLTFLDWHEPAAALAPDERRLPFDGHWSPAMHALSAQAIYDALQEKE